MAEPFLPDGDDDDAADAADHTIGWDQVDELPPMIGWVGDDVEKAKVLYQRLAGRDV
jgi:hypothetical protein